MKNRLHKSKIEDEIDVDPKFRDVFTDKYSLNGSKGRTIKVMRKDHSTPTKKYKKRKTYDIVFE